MYRKIAFLGLLIALSGFGVLSGRLAGSSTGFGAGRRRARRVLTSRPKAAPKGTKTSRRHRPVNRAGGAQNSRAQPQCRRR